MQLLRSFQLHKNKLEGTLPAEIDNWGASINTLALHHNQLDGSIAHMEKLSNLGKWST